MSSNPTIEPTHRTDRREQHEADYATVVDVVEDLGVDPSGEESARSAIADAAGDDTLLVFPDVKDASYLLDQHLELGGYDHLGLVGEGDAALKAPSGYNDLLVNIHGGTGLLWAGLDIDQTAHNAIAGVRHEAADDLTVRDWQFVGSGRPADFDHTTPADEQNAYLPIISDPGGSGLVERFVAKNAGGFYDWHGGDSRVGVWVGKANKGRLRFKGCRIEEFPNNGFYASRTPGKVQIEHSILRNNCVSQARLGGEGSWIRDSLVSLDIGEADVANPHPPNHGSQGIAFDSAKFAPGGGGAAVRDCRIEMLDFPAVRGGVTVWPGAGHHRISGTEITVADDARYGKTAAAAIRAEYPDGGHYPPRDEDVSLLVEDTTITGHAQSGAAVELTARPGSALLRSCVRALGSRDAIHASDSAPSVVATRLSVADGHQHTGEFARLDLTTGEFCPTRPGSDVFVGDDTDGTSDDSDGTAAPEATETMPDAKQQAVAALARWMRDHDDDRPNTTPAAREQAKSVMDDWESAQRTREDGDGGLSDTQHRAEEVMAKWLQSH